MCSEFKVSVRHTVSFYKEKNKGGGYNPAVPAPSRVGLRFNFSIVKISELNK